MVYLDSGIILQANPGYYFEITPRSSFAKKCPGWVMVNSPGIIDTNYRGTVQVCLQRFDFREGKGDFKLPLNAFQLVYRKIEPCVLQYVNNSSINMNTDRGEGGFGSTD